MASGKLGNMKEGTHSGGGRKTKERWRSLGRSLGVEECRQR